MFAYRQLGTRALDLARDRLRERALQLTEARPRGTLQNGLLPVWKTPC
jgi:hypothetical protein